MKVNVKLEISQRVPTGEVNDEEEFMECFEDPDPYCDLDGVKDDFGITNVESNFKVVANKTDDYFNRIIDMNINFSIEKLDELKGRLSEFEEGFSDGIFQPNDFVRIFIGDIETIFFGDDESVSVDAHSNDQEVNGQFIVSDN
jgi:hypothetical protein